MLFSLLGPILLLLSHLSFSEGTHKFPSIFIILLTLLSPIASKSLLNFIYYCVTVCVRGSVSIKWYNMCVYIYGRCHSYGDFIANERR